MLAALQHRMMPILCVGETQDEHDGGRALEVVLRQLQRGLEGVADEHMPRVVIAYEPVWAIGTGRTATPAQAQTVHGAIRERDRRTLRPRARRRGPDSLRRQRQRREC